MTKEETARLGRAIVKLKSLKKGDIRSFDTLARIYWEKGQFNNELFLPWNRAFLRYIEVTLQEIDANVVIPYWEWWNNAAIPKAFAMQTVKGDENPLWDPSRRGTTIDSAIVRTEGTEASKLQANFRGMSRSLEMEHNIVHGSVGGKMGTIDQAVHDPLNLAVMAAVDKRWFDWEGRQRGTEIPSPGMRLEPFSLLVQETFFTTTGSNE